MAAVVLVGAGRQLRRGTMVHVRVMFMMIPPSGRVGRLRQGEEPSDQKVGGRDRISEEEAVETTPGA